MCAREADTAEAELTASAATGDAYLCAANIVVDQGDIHAAVMVRFALAAMQVAPGQGQGRAGRESPPRESSESALQGSLPLDMCRFDQQRRPRHSKDSKQ